MLDKAEGHAVGLFESCSSTGSHRGSRHPPVGQAELQLASCNVARGCAIGWEGSSMPFASSFRGQSDRICHHCCLTLEAFVGTASELLAAPRSPTSSPELLCNLQETRSERLLASPTLGRVLVPCAAERQDVGHTVVVVLVQGHHRRLASSVAGDACVLRSTCCFREDKYGLLKQEDCAPCPRTPTSRRRCLQVLLLALVGSFDKGQAV